MPTYQTPPRILIVSRRSVRKNKYIDFVGEYHLDLLTQHNATPLILPRTLPPQNHLASLPTFHGLLLCEGEDISPLFRPHEPPPPPHINRLHSSDSTPDLPKDRLEFHLVRHCLKHHIPILAICRGAQLLNLCAGGTLLPDVHHALGDTVQHIDYDNYDSHRHGLKLVPGTPLFEWFDGARRIAVNSYHHQGVERLAARFMAMGYAPDGLVEAFYDAAGYDVECGRFVVGLQFHPERMQDVGGALRGEVGRFEYAGCERVYGAFVRAAHGFRERGADELRRVDMRRVAGVGSKYSREDMERIIRSGASVHGTRVVFNMIHGHAGMGEGEENEVDNGQGGGRRRGARHGAEWRRFERGVLMAENALKALQGTRKMKAALAMLEKLTREVALGDAPRSNR